MGFAETILYRCARSLYRTEVAHSSEMKSALHSDESQRAYRARESRRVSAALDRYGLSLVDKRVMDFGCNDGALSVEYLRLGACRVVGVDIDTQAVERARALHRVPGLSFEVSTREHIPVQDHSIDLVLSYDVFEHVADPRAALRQIHRALTPEGAVLIGTWGWRHPFAPHLWSVMPVPWAHAIFSERTLLRACRRVYLSDWYVPNMHDFDLEGRRLMGKYAGESIPTDYLNKYLIVDFERAFKDAGFEVSTHAVPFASPLANWTAPLTWVPGLREFATGYAWFVLRKAVVPGDPRPTAPSAATRTR